MKTKSIVFFLLSWICNPVWSQMPHVLIGLDNVSIPIFPDSSIAYDPSMILFQDSITETYYDLSIIQKSSSRFKVRIKGVKDHSHQIINAWIDKKYCYVWSLPQRNQLGQLIVRLYNAPDEKQIFTEIPIEIIIDEKYCVLDCTKTLWVKTILHTNKGDFEGWTKDYCSNVWGSCD